MRRRSLRTDPQVELTAEQRQRGLRAAREAARESRESLWRTARLQYRRYRATAGAAYLAWPRWYAEYLRAYHRWDGTKTSGSSNPWGGMPPGGGSVGGL